MDKQLEKYQSQLQLEAILKSVIFGLSSGAVTGLIVFVIGALTVNNLLVVGLIIVGVISIASTALLYFFAFQPSSKDVAQRVDVLGFEERTITMVELQDSDSFIAKVQREDANKELSKFTLKLLDVKFFVKPLLVLVVALILASGSVGFMITQVNAANNQPDPDVIVDDDALIYEMIEELISTINEANVPTELKSELYALVLALESRIPLHETYMEKYVDVLETRDQILMLIEAAIMDEMNSLMNIAQELQKYDNTEALGIALATWDLEVISASFDYMYDRIDDLLGQELFDVMLQTAIDIETALNDAVGTDEAMAEALQQLADAYKLASDRLSPGNEGEILEDFQVDQDAAEEALLESVQALIDLVAELLELQDELEEEVGRMDEFPLFMPWPEEADDSGDEGDPNITSENTVIDGVTPYEDVYDDYFEDAMDWLTSEDLSDEMRQIIEDYFEMLD